MKSRILLALAVVLAGCSTFTNSELAQLRQRNLRPELLAKFERVRPLLPEDLIELKRAGVPDRQVLKQLDDAGVNYVVTREDVRHLRDAHVSPRVIDELLYQSDRFAGHRYYPPYGDRWYYGDPWGPYYYGWEFGYGHYGYGWHGDFHHR